jgi:SNF2 family DNA or RNA helicase
MTNIVKALPETGHMVTVRQRRYVVSDVVRSALPADIVSRNGGNPQHLVSLSSIEEDALGETLQVIWEIEPDAHINEKSGLPDATGFDSPKRFDAFLNSVRWGAISSADIRSLQAPFRSGITIEDYQLDPLVRAVQMPRANLLIADDVGLGKTIEAGLIVQELLLRNRARTVLIVCPSSLQIQWRDQMLSKFGLEFRIVDSELMRILRRTRGLHTNPWAHFPRLITSIDFLKRDRPMRLFKEILPAEDESKFPRKFDILIIDEAHNVAPVGRGKYATDSLRTLAIRTIAPHFEHKLFLTATPHNGYKESFTALLELLDNQRFTRGIIPDRQQLQLVMVRRMKSELPAQFDGTPRFPKRHIQAIEVNYTNEEKQAHAWLLEYTELRSQNPNDAIERYATEFMMKMLKKRLFSSPAAFLLTLEKHLKTLEKTKPIADQHKPAYGILRQQLERG